MIDADIQRYYAQGRERDRLAQGGGTLEYLRTQELLRRYLPPPPATILDVGGGPGAYAAWLAGLGYRVHLIDPISLHIAQARDAAAAQPSNPFTAAVGDARKLEQADATFDSVLLLGPLYHLTERKERLAALAEVRRVLRLGGLALVAAISRLALLLDGMRLGYFADPEAAQIIEAGVRTGKNLNPGSERFPGWFTTAHLHQPEELAAEIVESGLELEALLGIEGPGGFIGNAWDDPQQRPYVLQAARLLEQEPSLLGLSGHLLAVARKAGDSE